jgi:hypothetical protein
MLHFSETFKMIFTVLGAVAELVRAALPYEL